MELKRTEAFKKIPYYELPLGTHKSFYQVKYGNVWHDVWYLKTSKTSSALYWINVNDNELEIVINPNTNSASFQI